MKAVILLGLIALSLAVRLDNEFLTKRKFDEFKAKFNKVYENPAEEAKRYNIFKQSLIRAEKSQKLNPRASFGITKFSDLTSEEFAASFLMPNLKDKLHLYAKPPVKNFSETSRPNARGCSPDPTNYDWNNCGVITPVYNQGQCGSCWAFSATETIESYFALDGGQLTQLSMEQIVDCDTSGEDQGCNGGFPTGAYQYVESAGGLDTLSSYPYTAGEGESGSCQFSQSNVAATVTNYQSIDGESGLYSQASSSSGGPVSVCVDASSWQDYSGGVLTQCGEDVDHCVQLTGYANYGQSGAYWIVRNSWGTDWGQNGYIWVAIGQNLCDIGSYATVVTAAQSNGYYA
jgi:C1A family cysteine protease